MRKTYWGQETARLVNDYDTIYLGDWSSVTPKSKGERWRERSAKFRENVLKRDYYLEQSDSGQPTSMTNCIWARATSQ